MAKLKTTNITRACRKFAAEANRLSDQERKTQLKKINELAEAGLRKPFYCENNEEKTCYNVLSQTPKGRLGTLACWWKLEKYVSHQHTEQIVTDCEASTDWFNLVLELIADAKNWNGPEILIPLQKKNNKKTIALNALIIHGDIFSVMLALTIEPERLKTIGEWLKGGPPADWGETEITTAESTDTTVNTFVKAVNILQITPQHILPSWERFKHLKELPELVKEKKQPSAQLITQLLYLEDVARRNAGHEAPEVCENTRELAKWNGMDLICPWTETSIGHESLGTNTNWGLQAKEWPLTLCMLGIWPDTKAWPKSDGTEKEISWNEWGAWGTFRPQEATLWRGNYQEAWLATGPDYEPELEAQLLSWAAIRGIAVTKTEPGHTAKPTILEWKKAETQRAARTISHLHKDRYGNEKLAEELRRWQRWSLDERQILAGLPNQCLAAITHQKQTTTDPNLQEAFKIIENQLKTIW